MWPEEMAVLGGDGVRREGGRKWEIEEKGEGWKKRTLTLCFSEDSNELQLSKQEREIYDLIYTRAKKTFKITMEIDVVLKSYTTIFA